MSAPINRIPLDRRVCVVREGRIDVRPERSATVGPFLGVAVSLLLFASVAVFGDRLSLPALAAMLIPGLILGPFSAMGLVYSLLGSHVVIDAKKQSATFQQGVLGLGLGTVKLAPFWKIERVEVQDLPLGEVDAKGPTPPLELRGWDVVLMKTSGEQLSVGQVIAANSPDLIDEGFDRALDVAEAVSALVGKPVLISAAVEDRSQEAAAEPAGPEAEILRKYRVVAVVGISSREERPSNRVARYLKEQGYRIIPVNPRETEVLGERCYPDLCSVAEPVEVVDIFRRATQVPRVVAEALYVGAKAVWMQEGIVHEAAARRARAAGMEVVMDRCMMMEHRKLKGG